MSDVDEVLKLFPDLDRKQLKITSPETSLYNCVAFAAGETTAWWEPDPLKYCYWPRSAPRSHTVMAYQAALATKGFVETNDSSLSEGVEKIAIFHINRVPTHVARQTADGLWTSKLGQSFDIQHDLQGLVGKEYGEIALFMQRKRP